MLMLKKPALQVSRFVLLSARVIHVIAAMAFALWANAATSRMPFKHSITGQGFAP